MSDAVRRGKPSKIDMLPEDIKKMLDEMLRDSGNSQADILDAINRRILDAGMDEEATISRSGLSRHAQKTEAIGKRLRELRETTKALTAELGDKPTGDTTKMILEMGRSQLFTAMQKQMLNPSEDDDVDIGMIKDAMLAAQRLEATAMKAHQREKDIRKAFAEEAANAVGDELRGEDGMSEELEDKIRGILLGKA
ncbi:MULTISPECIES: DUF3486 family protein [Pseudoalteromonas]|uniref:DUF3486 family protein n=1 Tax=Pseudoalteromonas piscicida TaxID=43662 RepID=A0AAD0RI06_PSEO7|nr:MULTISPECIES: DUF3486 family protein [Pseudoalteromonas]ASD67710.1 hypothetical protein B1L02_12225 [Pseudoalteromonas piscicida]AXR01586.1 DUF3486 family protein [Pseudoalteromonas piscicida]NSY36566.1 DUF3486 family protein [Pseudoalteromonas sp. JC28]